MRRPKPALRPTPPAPTLARFYTREGRDGCHEVVDRQTGQVLSRWSSAVAALAERDRLAAASPSPLRGERAGVRDEPQADKLPRPH
jgi:hypothetical protein